MLNELSAICRCQPQVHSLNEMLVIFQISIDNLLGQFIGF